MTTGTRAIGTFQKQFRPIRDVGRKKQQVLFLHVSELSQQTEVTVRSDVSTLLKLFEDGFIHMLSETG